MRVRATLSEERFQADKPAYPGLNRARTDAFPDADGMVNSSRGIFPPSGLFHRSKNQPLNKDGPQPGPGLVFVDHGGLNSGIIDMRP